MFLSDEVSMKAPRVVIAFVGCLALVLAAIVAQPAAQSGAGAGTPPADVLKRLTWRNIGPTVQAGRVPVFVGLPGDINTLYVAGAVGGIFKSTNGGVTWAPIFDDKPVTSIGAIAIAPTDPNVIYVGTGEGNPRNDASIGDGIYKSIDAGAHWTNVGLPDSEKIARLVIDPRNADVVYACALGREWGPNEERGLFKTVDGGRNWKKILYKNDLTGCSDVDIDPPTPTSSTPGCGPSGGGPGTPTRAAARRRSTSRSTAARRGRGSPAPTPTAACRRG